MRGKLINMKSDRGRQPERDVLRRSLRGMGQNLKRLVSAGTGNGRGCITEQSFEQPAQPPMFCMLLRKHLSSAKITEITQPQFERLVIFDLDATDELGTPVKRRLAVELMGRSSNIILIDGEGIIIDCLRRVGLDKSDKRQVLPGLVYRLPPSP